VITRLAQGFGPVLDVGCGSSRILASIPGMTGLDVQLHKLRYSRRYENQLVHGSIFDLPFADASFDCLICSEVIEHIPAEEKAFDELSRVLKSGGRLILGTPDYDRAAQWVADQFKAAGLQPGGTDGYFQRLPINWVDLKETPELASVGANGNPSTRSGQGTTQSFVWKKDFRVGVGGLAGPGYTTAAPVVFAGWGIAEQDYSDYTIETQDKVVMVLQPDFTRNQQVPIRRTRGPQETAIFKKAAAILTVARDDSRMDFKGSYLTNLADKTIPTFTISRAAADALLAGTGKTVAQLYDEYDRKVQARVEKREQMKQDDAASFETKARVRLSVYLQPITQQQTENVIGVLPGTDDARKDKAVILGAHLAQRVSRRVVVVYNRAYDSG